MKITTTLTGSVPILEPNGKIVGPAVSELRERLALWIDEANTPCLCIDFTAVRKIDSSALGMLVNMHVLAERHGTRLGLINVGKHIKNLIVITRLMQVFQCFPSVAAAVSTFAPPLGLGNLIVKQLPTAPVTFLTSKELPK